MRSPTNKLKLNYIYFAIKYFFIKYVRFGINKYLYASWLSASNSFDYLRWISSNIVIIFFGTRCIDRKYNIMKWKRTMYSADLIVVAASSAESRFTHESKHFLSLRIVKGQYLKLLRFQVRCFSCMLVLYPPCTIFYSPRTFCAWS